MEKWIERHAGKLVLAFGLLVSFSFVDIVRHGVAEILRIKRLENQVNHLESQVNHLESQASNHTHRYYDGKPNQQRRMK